jgi:chromosome segregation ATPase
LLKKKKSIDAQLEQFAARVDELETAKAKLEKAKKDLETERDQLKDELEGAESAAVAEALKKRLDVELGAANDRVKQAEELRAAAEEQRRGFQGQVTTLQAQLEDEAKLRAKAEAAKKKLEVEIAELEKRLDRFVVFIVSINICVFDFFLFLSFRFTLARRNARLPPRRRRRISSAR